MGEIVYGYIAASPYVGAIALTSALLRDKISETYSTEIKFVGYLTFVLCSPGLILAFVKIYTILFPWY